MKKYEYAKLSDIFGTEISSTLLSKIGRDGYRLIETIVYPSGHVDYILERPYEEEEIEKEMD